MQIAFEETCRMILDSLTFIEFVLCYRFIDRMCAVTFRTSQSVTTDDI